MAAAILLGLALFFGGLAEACTVDRSLPYDPTEYPAKIVIGGMVTGEGRSAGEPFADIQVSDVFVGTFTQPTFRLKWWIYDGSGRCSPPGPNLKKGQQVLIYLHDLDGEAMGWTAVHRIGTELPSIRDTLSEQEIAQYFADVPASRLDTKVTVSDLPLTGYRIIRPDADLNQLVSMDQDAALLRERRQAAYFSAGGALSYTDPDTWVTAEELRQLKQNKFDIFVSFEVGGDGRIGDCTSNHVKKAQADDLAVCKIIKERIRLVPPLFAEERSGRLELHR
ncbi:hypothetical protein [Sphingopyxis panaciterrae]